MSAELAALRLGTTVANTAAQMWLGGKRREQERRLPMEELTRLRVPGLRQRRSLQRQFEGMADAVAARIEPFLAQEFRGLDESSREAALNGVCDTFARANLSDEAVLAADAQPAVRLRGAWGLPFLPRPQFPGLAALQVLPDSRRRPHHRPRPPGQGPHHRLTPKRQRPHPPEEEWGRRERAEGVSASYAEPGIHPRAPAGASRPWEADGGSRSPGQPPRGPGGWP